MKTTLTLLSLFLCTSVFAGSVAVPPLPAPEYLDTEVTTNVVFSLPEKIDTFTVELSLNATPTNNVQISFGHDASPANGKLSPFETELTVGWDCGKWFLETNDALTHLEAEPTGTNLFKTISLSLALRADGTVREATVTDGSTRLFADEPLSFPAATSWNMLKATARGFGVHGESFKVFSSTHGTKLIFR